MMADDRDRATDPENKDLATEGAKERLKGAGKELEGRVRGTVGAARGDTGQQVKGKAKQRLDPDPGVDED
jgi:uncharacterized protein YjbJ (UPF0337 family)